MPKGSPEVTEYCVLLPRTLQRGQLGVGVTEWCALDCEPGILKGLNGGFDPLSGFVLYSGLYYCVALSFGCMP